MSVKRDLNKLSKQLYPTGKAFSYNDDSELFKLHDGLNDGFEDVVNDGKSLFDSIFPDSDDFSIEDVRLWEYNLGISSYDNLTLGLRKESILRKITHPNNVIARQHYLFIQNQLQKSGFGVYVHENAYPYQTPGEVTGVALEDTQMSDSTQMGGGTQLGGTNYKLVANRIDPKENYIVGDDNIWATFFIGGKIKGTSANIPYANERALRELILRLKPAHTIAYLFIAFYDTYTVDSNVISADNNLITADSI